MSIEDIKNRLAAATPGPWDWTTHDMAGARWSLEGKGEGVLTCAAMLWPDETNAEFIAHAPEDIARLVKALEAVAELADSYEMTAEMIRHTPNDKALLNAAARDIRRTIATVMNP